MKFYAREISGARQIRQFVNLPWRLYKSISVWVPPLKIEMRHKLRPKRNPFFEHGDVQLYGVFNTNNELVGRVAAILNSVNCRTLEGSVGYFGLFECINSVEASKVLMARASDWLKAHGCTHIHGPVNFDTNGESGFLVEGYDQDPMVMCNYCLSYYPDLMRTCGLSKTIDLLAYGGRIGHYFPEKYTRILKRVTSNNAVTLNCFDRRRASMDIAAILEIYNRSFDDVWGFMPLTSSEAEAMGRSLLRFGDVQLVWIASYHNKPVGFVLALPNSNEILKNLNGRVYPFGIFTLLRRRHRVQSIRVMVLCVLPHYRSLGIEVLLIGKIHRRMLDAGYRCAEFSVVMENNRRMRDVLEDLGFQATKRYRIYGARMSERSMPSKMNSTTGGLLVSPKSDSSEPLSQVFTLASI